MGVGSFLFLEHHPEWLGVSNRLMLEAGAFGTVGAPAEAPFERVVMRRKSRIHQELMILPSSVDSQRSPMPSD